WRRTSKKLGHGCACCSASMEARSKRVIRLDNFFGRLFPIYGHIAQSHSGNCGSGSGNRSRHASGFQLGSGAVWIVGCGGDRRYRCSHEERESAGGRERREVARGWKEILVWRRSQGGIRSGLFRSGRKGIQAGGSPGGRVVGRGGEEIQGGGQKEFGRFFSGFGGRCRVHRVSLEDEYDRQRHCAAHFTDIKAGWAWR